MILKKATPESLTPSGALWHDGYMNKYELIERKPVNLLCQHHMPARLYATRLVKFHDTNLISGIPFSREIPLCDEHASQFVSLAKKPATAHSECSHESTKSARAKCRRERSK